MIALLAAMTMAAQTPMPIRTRAFPGLGDDGLEVGCMVMTSGHMLFGPEGFGGYSGMSFDQGTSQLTLLSDRGHLLELPVETSESGAITGVGMAVKWSLSPPQGMKGGLDTEALVPWADGYLISRERVHDIVLAKKSEFDFKITEVAASFAKLEPVKSNGGYEGVTAMGGGTLLAIPETSTSDGSAAVVRWDGSNARVVARYRVEPDHSVTELFADPKSDRLFVLERAYDRKRGPRAKISVVALSALDTAGPDEVVEGEELGRMNFLQGADNMEAMVFLESPDGTQNLWLASDDNFNELQRTVLMSLQLTETCPLQPTP